MKFKCRQLIYLILFFAFAKPSLAQNVLEAKAIGGGGYETASQIKVQQNGTSYIIGNFTTTLSFPTINTTFNAGTTQDIVIVKKDSLGNVIAAFSCGGPSTDYAKSITVDDTGNVYISGLFTTSINVGGLSASGSTGLINFFICKLSPTFTPIWLTTVNGAVNYALENNLVLNSNNEIIVAGSYSGTAVFNASTSVTALGATDAFVAKYSNAGVFQWVRSFGGTATDAGQSVALDASDNIYVGGSFFSASCSFGTTSLTKSPSNAVANGFVIKLSNAGVNLDLKQFFANNFSAKDLKINAAGELVLGGTYSGTLTVNSTSVTAIGSNESYLCKLNNLLQPIWLNRIGVASTGPISSSSTVFYGLAQNNFGDIFVTGYFFGSTSFGSIVLNTIGSSSIFFASADANGNWKWAIRAGSSAFDVGADVDTDTSGYAYFTGQFSGIAIFGTKLLFSASSNPDIFYIKIGECDSNLAQINSTGPTTICSGLGSQLLAPVQFGYTYQWLKNGAIIPFAVDTQYVANTAGNYQVVVTNGGCVDTSAIVPIAVNQSPTVGISSSSTQVCENAAPILISTSPSGGILSGSGITGAFFNPAAVGPGQYILQYAYTAPSNGCSDTANLTIQVTGKPTSVLTPLGAVCSNQASFNLNQGFPAGGQYFGTGITGNQFDPQVGVGSFTIGYKVTNSQGCSDTSFQQITVNQAPTVSQNPLGFTCSSNLIFPLSGGSPSGGTYSGNAVVNNNFYPLIAGPGNYPISYTYQAANGCTGMSVDTVKVEPPFISFVSVGKVCESTPAFQLTNASPSGGTYQGIGVLNNQFDAATAGVGVHTITYVVSNSCGNSIDSFQIEVVPNPIVSYAINQGICENSSPINLSGGTPAGGIYSGTGVSNSTFNPIGLNTGFYPITYSFTDTNNCSASTSDSIQIFALPSVSLLAMAAICEDAPSFQLSNGLPLGGVYSGANISGGIFNTSSASLGYQTYAYSFTDTNSCTNTVIDSLLVVGVPSVSISGDATICLGDTASLLALPSNLNYAWSTGSTSQSIDLQLPTDTTVSVTVTDGNGCSSVDSLEIIVNALPLVSVGNYASVCANDSVFLLQQGSPLGGIYSGNGVSNQVFNATQIATNQTSIYYSYTDANGCSSIDSTTLLITPLPTISKVSSLEFCEDAPSSVLANFNPVGGNYQGAGIQNDSAIVSNLNVGQNPYSYTYTDTNGCTNTALDSILIRPLPNFTITGNTTICKGDTAQLSGSNNTYSYYWSNGSNSVTISVNDTVSTAYTVTATTSFGCTKSVTTTLIVNSLPSVSINNIPALCANNAPVLLSASPIGGTFTGVAINGNNFLPSQANIGNNTIAYFYTDTNGCTSSATAIIAVNSIPTVALSPVSILCENSPALFLNTGSPAGGQYFGTGVTNNTFVPNQNNIGINAYSYTFADANGCSDTATSQIQVNGLPNFSLSGNQNLCSGDTSFLSVSGLNGATGFWSTGNTTTTITYAPNTSGYVAFNATDSAGCAASDSIFIQVNALPAVNAVQAIAVCQNEAPFALSLGTPAGGTYSIAGSTLSSIDPSTFIPGNYTITYSFTNSNGCTAFDTTTLTVLAMPQVAVLSTLEICENENPVSLNLCTPVAGTYTGSGISNNTFSPSAALIGFQTYSYSFTNSSNCTVSITDSIKVLAKPIVAISGDTAICINDTIQLTATNNLAAYNWNISGNTSPILTEIAQNSGTSTYAVTATNNDGCSDSASFNVLVNPLPSISFAPFAPLCENESVIALNGGLPLGGFYGGAFVQNDSLFVPIDSTSATVTYNYIDANGCANSISQTIQIDTLPLYTLSPDTEICVGDTAEIAISGTINVLWNTGDTAKTIQVSPILASTYTVVISNGNACSIADSVRITVNYPDIISIDAIDTLCANAAPIALNATPIGGMFSGNGITLVDTTYFFDPQLTTTDSVQVYYTSVSAKGCESSDSVVAYIVKRPHVILSSGTSYCEGENVTLAVEAPYNIIWQDSLYDEAVSVIALPEINLLDLQLVGNNCSFDTSITLIINPLPRFSLPNDTTICSVNTIQLLGPNEVESYLWSTGETTNSIVIEGNRLTTSEQTFWLLVTSDNGCEYADSIAINRVFCNTELGAFLLYPNPTSGSIALQYNSLEEIPLQFNLYSAVGASIGESLQAINIGKNTYEFDLSYLASGVYYLVISAGDNQIVKEIVVAR